MDSGIGKRTVRWAAWFVVLGALAVVLPVAHQTAVPGTCVHCHDMGSDSGTSVDSAHAAVECASCHADGTLAERMRFGYHQVFGMRLPFVDLTDSVTSSVSDSACTGCHGRLDTVTESRGLRVMHDTCGEGSRCVSCHSPVAHPDGVRWPTTYAMERCLECHGAREASQSCDTCHMGRIERIIPATGTFPITHGPNWRSTHGMGEMTTCRACHSDDFCRPCHGSGVPHTPRFVSVHGAAAESSDAECLSCHQSSMCDDCHVYEMPHPLSFTEQHRQIVANDGEAQCRYCHLQDDCMTCHEMHIHPGGAGPLEPVRGDER